MSRILVVEDDPNVATFLTTILLGAGYVCLGASNAEKARQLLETENDIGLVILDQNLGEATETGLALLTALRQSPRFRALPAIICTGDARSNVVAGFLGQRITSFVRKPFRPERLLADVQRALGREEVSSGG